MSNHKQLVTRLAEIQAELRDLTARHTDIGSKECHALREAIDWLGDVTNPLTDAELELWAAESEAYCSTCAEDTDANTVHDMLSDADKRTAIEYMKA